MEIKEDNIALVVKLVSPVNKMTFRAERLLKFDASEEELVTAFENAMLEVKVQMTEALREYKHLIYAKKVSAIPEPGGE